MFKASPCLTYFENVPCSWPWCAPSPKPDEGPMSNQDSSPLSEARFNQLIATIPQQVWTAQPDGSLDYVNQQVIDYFGLSYETMLGTGWVDIVHPDDMHEAIIRWAKSLATGNDYENDFRLRRADGVYRWHIARASALMDANGNIQ